MSNRERAYQLITRICQIPVGSPEFNAAVYAAEMAFESALSEAGADSRRLDKVERMQADVEYQLGGAWKVTAYNWYSAGALREAIDGVPE